VLALSLVSEIFHEGRNTNVLPLDIVFSCMYDKTTIGIAKCVNGLH